MDGAVRNERTLLRIAALLVSLSLLAERAAGRSFPVRFLVLAILGRAEVVARAFVAGATQTEWPCLGEAPEFAGHPTDAAWLALRLRMLAAILVDFLDAACRAAGRDLPAGGAPRPAPVLLLLMPATRRPRPRDTS